MGRDVATPTQKNDRLAPPLMHAFRAAHRDRDATVKVDIRDQGERVIASRRLMARAPISETELRKTVNTELVALFNTTNLEFDRGLVDRARGPKIDHQLRVSCLSLAERSTRTKSAESRERSKRRFATSSRGLCAGSIKARRDDTVSPDELRVRFLVSAALKTQPVEVPVQFVAEVELDSGKIKLDRL